LKNIYEEDWALYKLSEYEADPLHQR
jgi:hypothetical protein